MVFLLAVWQSEQMHWRAADWVVGWVASWDGWVGLAALAELARVRAGWRAGRAVHGEIDPRGGEWDKYRQRDWSGHGSCIEAQCYTAVLSFQCMVDTDRRRDWSDTGSCTEAQRYTPILSFQCVEDALS